MRARSLLLRFVLVVPFLVALASWAAQGTLHSDLLSHDRESPIVDTSLMADVPKAPAPGSFVLPRREVRIPVEVRHDPLPDPPAVEVPSSRGPPARRS